MLSHVEMAPAAAAGGFKLFGKVITQCGAEGTQAAASASASPVFITREEEQQQQPAVSARESYGGRDRATIKRETVDADLDEKRRQGGDQAETEISGGQQQQPPPRRTQQQLQETAEARAAAAAPLPCPRCRSRDTKFCYFNNYNVNQPRHFCKACHRYWTAGGALRNVPVGAGRRKNRPLGPVATIPGLHHHHRAAAGFVLGFPNPSSPTSPSPVYADRWPVGPDRRFS